MSSVPKSPIEQLEGYIEGVRAKAVEIEALIGPMTTAAQAALQGVSPNFAAHGAGFTWPLTYDSQVRLGLSENFFGRNRLDGKPPFLSANAPRPLTDNNVKHFQFTRAYQTAEDEKKYGEYGNPSISPTKVRPNLTRFVLDLAAWGEAMAERGYDLLLAIDLNACIDDKKPTHSQANVQVYANLPSILEYFKWRTGDPDSGFVDPDTSNRPSEEADIWASPRLIVGAQDDLRSILPELELTET